MTLEIIDLGSNKDGYKTLFKWSWHINPKLICYFKGRIIDGWPTRDFAAPQEDC